MVRFGLEKLWKNVIDREIFLDKKKKRKKLNISILKIYSYSFESRICFVTHFRPCSVYKLNQGTGSSCIASKVFEKEIHYEIKLI